jgi:uncharacterized damage-inducible protein DinB
MPKPELSTVPEFYHKYVNQIQEEDVYHAIQVNTKSTLSFLRTIPEEKWDHRYAEGKWTIKEMIQHVIDAERIFSYRALCFARGEKLSLPGFEENDYAAASKAERRTKEDLIIELETVRKSIEQLYTSFDEEQLASTGIANNNPITVNAIGFIIPGHTQHHMTILKERYL